MPGEFLDDLRKAIRKHLRKKGFRSQTMIGNGVLHVMSDDALEAIEPTVRAAWIDQCRRDIPRRTLARRLTCGTASITRFERAVGLNDST